jgi:hypothetical protein
VVAFDIWEKLDNRFPPGIICFGYITYKNYMVCSKIGLISVSQAVGGKGRF